MKVVFAKLCFRDILGKFHYCKLIIAGNTRGQKYKWLEDKISKDEKIIFYDTPQDLATLYKSASVFINPMLHGAGVKLKTINAIQNGLPVISTTIGVEGTGLKDKEHILLADEPNQFFEYVKFLLEHKEERIKLVKQSQDFLKKNYSHSKILMKLLTEKK